MSVNRNADARAKLAAPTFAMLPKIADSLSFLYLDIVRIVQDDTGVCAQIETENGTDTVYLPTAALSCVLLGPGTSITARALSTLARHGTTVVCTGSGGVRDQLWEATSAVVGDGAALLIHPAANEQGFTLDTAGTRRRHPADFDGLTLIRMTAQPRTASTPD